MELLPTFEEIRAQTVIAKIKQKARHPHLRKTQNVKAKSVLIFHENEYFSGVQNWGTCGWRLARRQTTPSRRRGNCAWQRWRLPHRHRILLYSARGNFAKPRLLPLLRRQDFCRSDLYSKRSCTLGRFFVRSSSEPWLHRISELRLACVRRMPSWYQGCARACSRSVAACMPLLSETLYAHVVAIWTHRNRKVEVRVG